ncbi:MAG: sigma-E processing peptidase SpoIIGA [Clostridia bacterium]|nr:sigma-E processing peptidase SpoIIGA [Clostridia bacterium]
MVIYADILVALNALIDYFLLRSCGAIRRMPLKRGRLLCASLLGGVAALQIFLPVRGVWAILLSAGSGILLCATAFGFGGMWNFLRNVLCLMGLSFACSAGMYGLWFFLRPEGMYWHNGYVYFDISPMEFVVLTLLTYALLTVGWRVLQRRDRREGRVLRIRLTHSGRSVCGRGLVDSGNLLREPLSGCPVVVVDETLLAEIQPQILHPEQLTPTEAVQEGFRMVQFQTMHSDGCMAACRIGGITSSDAKLIPATALYAAACPGLKARTGWDMILPAAALAEDTDSERSRCT